VDNTLVHQCSCGQEALRNHWFWGQTRHLGSKEEMCLPGSPCLCESTKEQASIAWNGDGGSSQSHEAFPCLRAGVLLILNFLLMLITSSHELKMKHAMDAERTDYAHTRCLDQNWFLLQSILLVTYPHYTLIACFIFGVLALPELSRHLCFT